ncbi:hypothetical protein [Actinomadura montaniterrae]|uniref:Uncharacterized protein n=1 Tax=Actinomadura montaniterrae TaxID=1803903 RepID=A0A6L3VR11_9ACTN|nr:hypothetical protein [Actinomadura montaniterrae]KAB2372047.1 hypothetical protein F9B16_30745 [Actinomadura montaniterrae]
MGYKIHPAVARHSRRVSAAVREGHEAEEEKARRDLAWAKVQAAAEKAVADYPLPTPEQADRILGLLGYEAAE